MFYPLSKTVYWSLLLCIVVDFSFQICQYLLYILRTRGHCYICITDIHTHTHTHTHTYIGLSTQEQKCILLKYKCVISIHINMFMQTCFLFTLLNIWVKLLWCIISIYLDIWEMTTLFFKLTISFAIPTEIFFCCSFCQNLVFSIF